MSELREEVSGFFSKAKQQITKPEDAVRFQQRAGRIKLEYSQFVINTLEEEITNEILVPLKEEMARIPVDQKVIDSTFVDKATAKSQTGIVLFIRSNYVSDTGFPVAVMLFKTGRKAFFTAPTEKEAQFWLDPVTGAPRFSKGHDIPRLPASDIIKAVILKNRGKVQKNLNIKTVRWMNSIFFG